MSFFFGHAGPPPPPPFLTAASANGRYLVDQFGNPFLPNADTPWNLDGGHQQGFTGTGLDQSDIAYYLNDRVAKGYNTILFSVGGLAGTGADNAGNAPFTTFPTLNPAYWSNVDVILQMCTARGLSVFLDVMDAYDYDASGFSAANCQTYGNSLATRWADKGRYPGLVWFFGNDYGGSGVGLGNTTNIDALYGATGGSGFIAGLTAAGDTRLRTVELGYYADISTDGSNWGGVTLQWVYNYQPTYSQALRAWAHSPSLPAVFGEGVYENATTGFPDNPIDFRKITLWPLTSGCPGTFHGIDGSTGWQFQSGWQAALSSTVETQRTVLYQIWQSLEWWKLAPDTGSALVTAGRNTQFTGNTPGNNTPTTSDATYGNYVTAAVASDSSFGVIYNPNGSTLTLSSTPVGGGSPWITRIDPTNGAQISVAWTTSLTSPGNNAGGDPDWLYLIAA